MALELLTLRQAREWRAHSQVSLALAAQVNRRTLSDIELSKRFPKPATKRKIAAALNIDPWQIEWPRPERAGP